MEKIKKHLIKKQHHYKIALLAVLLFAIFFFANIAGNDGYQMVEQAMCRSDRDCFTNQFCEFDICSSKTGRCVNIPELCPALLYPVCGCDGKTYSNECVRRVSKVSKKHNSACA